MATKATAPAAPAATGELDFSAIVAAAVVAAIPTAAQRAMAQNPFTDLLSGMLLNGKPRTAEQCTEDEPGSRIIVVPGPINGEADKKATRLLNDAGNALGVTVKKSKTQGVANGQPVTQVQFWAVEKQERKRS